MMITSLFSIDRAPLAGEHHIYNFFIYIILSTHQFQTTMTLHEIYDDTFDPTLDSLCDDDPLFNDEALFDDEAFARGFGFPSITLSEEDFRFLRDFILGSAMYVEQLENLVSESSDEFWEAREHAYRLITNALIGFYEYEMKS